MSTGRGTPGRRAPPLLGALLLATAALGLLLLGGAWPGARVVLHGGTAVALLTAAMLSDRNLGNAGHLPRWTLGIGLFACAIGAGLVPWPAALLRLVAPGAAADWPDAAWRVASTDPEGTVSALAMWALVGGFGAAIVAWDAAGGRRWQFQRGLVAITALLVATAGLHLATGTEALFGVIPTSLVDGRAFFAPFVSRNHFGAALLLLAPTVIGDALVHRRGSGAIPRGILAVGVLTLLVLTGSPGIAAAGLAMIAVEGWRRLRARAVLYGAPVAAAALLSAPLTAWIVAPWLQQALFPRFAMWRDGLALVAWSPLFGVGAGGFGEAIERVRSDCVARLWVHAHDAPLEWWLETGAFGLLAAAAALVALRPGPARDDGERARRLALGWVGLAVHNLVDFSLQLPAVAVLAAGIWAARMSVYGERRPLRPAFARALVAGFALAQVPAAGWAWTQALADVAAVAVDRSTGSPREASAAAERVGRFAPWRSEADLAEMWSAEAEGDVAGAIALARAAAAAHRTDGDAQRRIAHLLWRHRACPEALATVARARELQPASWRAAVLDARISRRCDETERMVDAWTRALTCQAPKATMVEAYASFPIAVAWVDRLADEPARLRRLASVADRAGDSASAALAWDLAALSPDYAHDVEHVEVLVRAGRLDDARARLAAVRAAHPDHPRLPAVTALLATEAGAEAPDVPSSSLARAIRAVEAERGARAAMGEVQRQELLGNALDPTLAYEKARLHALLGDPRSCAVALDAAGLPSHPVLGEQARSLRSRCEQEIP